MATTWPRITQARLQHKTKDKYKSMLKLDSRSQVGETLQNTVKYNEANNFTDQ